MADPSPRLISAADILTATGVLEIDAADFVVAPGGKYGAIGDGATHPLSQRFGTLAAAQAIYPHAVALTDEIDWAALQSAINAASVRGGRVHIVPPPGKYLINRPLVAKVTLDDLVDVGDLGTSDIHFTDINRIDIVSSGAWICATAAMTEMLKYTYDTTDSDLTPLYSGVYGLKLDCNGLANDGIFLDWGMHSVVHNNSIFGFLNNGVRWWGRGVHSFTHNTIRGPRCFFIDGAVNGSGGDSFVNDNDLYPTQIGMTFQGWSGNTEFSRNTVTREGSGTIIGCDLDGTQATRTIQDVRILSNEFRGLDTGVKVRRHASARNIYNILVEDNHTNAYSTYNSGVLVDATGMDESHIGPNFINGKQISDATGAQAILLTDCRSTSVRGPHAANLTGRFATLTDCQDCSVTNSVLTDVGKGSSSGSAIVIDGAGLRNIVDQNIAFQSSASYAQTFLTEAGTSNLTRGLGNRLTGFTTPAVLIGASSGWMGLSFSAGSVSFRDKNDAVMFHLPFTGNAVNYAQSSSAVAGGFPSLGAVGADTNIYLGLAGKGTNGVIISDGGGTRRFRCNTTGIGFNGATEIAKPVLSAALSTGGAATNADIAVAYNSLRTALINYGLCI